MAKKDTLTAGEVVAEATAKAVAEQKPQPQVLSTEMTEDFVSQYRFHVHDLRLLRFVDDQGVLYQLDNLGMGRFVFRMVGE